jgi:hypothetical protein
MKGTSIKSVSDWGAKIATKRFGFNDPLFHLRLVKAPHCILPQPFLSSKQCGEWSIPYLSEKQTPAIRKETRETDPGK